jgi:hypothetical protein
VASYCGYVPLVIVFVTPVMCNTHILYLLFLFSNVVCVYFAFYLLAPAVLVLSFSVLAFPLSCGGCLNVSRVLASISILFSGGLGGGGGVGGWKGCTVILCKSCDERNVTTIAGRNNINKKDTYIFWTNGWCPKRRRVVKIKIKIKIKIILRTKF